MSFPAVLFAPLVLLLPAAGGVDAGVAAGADLSDAAPMPAAAPGREGLAAANAADAVAEPGFRVVVDSLRGEVQNQVRIEQHTTIRIAPRARSVPVQPNFLIDMPGREEPPRLIERPAGRCVAASSISGVQPDGGNRLLLFMRDRRVLSAQLERSCRSRDFYSGFYVERSTDGQLCVDRDTLLSRSGANCKLSRLRQLVATGG